MLLVQPLACAAQLQPGTVHQQVEGAGPGAGAWSRHLDRRGPSTQHAVVGHGEVEPEQAHDGADQLFDLAQGEAEHRPQGQGSQDGETRVGRLPTPGRPRLGLPGRDGLRGEPHHQTPAPAQAGVILTPVRDLESLPGNAVATVGIGFEGIPRQRAAALRPRAARTANRRIAATRLARLPRWRSLASYSRQFGKTGAIQFAHFHCVRRG